MVFKAVGCNVCLGRVSSLPPRQYGYKGVLTLTATTVHPRCRYVQSVRDSCETMRNTFAMPSPVQLLWRLSIALEHSATVPCTYSMIMTSTPVQSAATKHMKTSHFGQARPQNRSVGRYSRGVKCNLSMHEVEAVRITPEEFSPFGQFVEPIDDMKTFDEDDAQLQLDKGTPRFYIMRLPLKPSGLVFTQITHHKQVSQCLGSLTPSSWYMAVAPPGIEHLKPPDLSVFKVPFGTFIKMNPGTWHAGPHFDTPNYMDFYNLELSDTNQVDHYNFHFDDALQTAIKIIPCD